MLFEWSDKGFKAVMVNGIKIHTWCLRNCFCIPDPTSYGSFSTSFRGSLITSAGCFWLNLWTAVLPKISGSRLCNRPSISSKSLCWTFEKKTVTIIILKKCFDHSLNLRRQQKKRCTRNRCFNISLCIDGTKMLKSSPSDWARQQIASTTSFRSSSFFLSVQKVKHLNF